jgi:lauroyl/myristoyl acyltransferase
MMIGIFKLLALFLGALPGKKTIATVVGTISAWFPIKEGELAKLQMKWILGDKAPPLKKVYTSIVLQILELCNLPNLTSRVKNRPDDQIKEIISRKRPIVGLTGHLGNWDLIAAYCSSVDVPLFAVGREARNSLIHELLVWLRGRAGIKVLWRSSRSAMEGAREITKALKVCGIVASLIDQDINSVSSEPSLFFGHECRTPAAMIDMGLQHNAIFISAFCIRHEDDTFTLQIKEITKDSIPEIIEEFNQDLEAVVRAHPEQWMWVHKRWRTQNGKTLSSKEYAAWLKEQITLSHSSS